MLSLTAVVVSVSIRQRKHIRLLEVVMLAVLNGFDELDVTLTSLVTRPPDGCGILEPTKIRSWKI